MKIFREKSDFRLEYFGKRVYSYIFTHWDDHNSREFQKRWGPDFDENLKLWSTFFGEKFEFHLVNFGKSIYFCIFTHCGDRNPGNFRKGGGPDFRENCKFWRPPKNLRFLNFGRLVKFFRFRKLSKKSPFLINLG